MLTFPKKILSLLGLKKSGGQKETKEYGRFEK
jgi:hypothetical protein